MEEIKFAILDGNLMKHVTNLINIQEIKLSQYHLMIDFHVIQKEKYTVPEVNKGIVLKAEILCRQSLGFQKREKGNECCLEPWERRGVDSWNLDAL